MESADAVQTNPVVGVDEKTIQTLAKGVMELYEPPLTTMKTQIQELKEKQDAITAMITSGRRKLEDLENDATFDALLADVATNKEKVVSLSSSILVLHNRVQLLQARAANVEKAAKLKAAQK